MLKLYKNINGQLHYWETWDVNEKSGMIHWGIVGEKGQDKVIESGLFSNFTKKIQSEVDVLVKDGYHQIEDEDHSILLIEYQVDGMGTPQDIDKRTRLQSRMDDTLGWTGLGNCDGGSIGSGTMEVACFVVDFKIAKDIIEKDLKGTEFENYIRIYDENE